MELFLHSFVGLYGLQTENFAIIFTLYVRKKGTTDEETKFMQQTSE
jgi:hypothetical protein